MYKKLLFLAISALAALPALAQQQQVEMAFDMRSSGKIYVVVAVLAAIFIGLAVYLVVLDRKISRLEKALKANTDSKN